MKEEKIIPFQISCTNVSSSRVPMKFYTLETRNLRMTEVLRKAITEMFISKGKELRRSEITVLHDKKKRLCRKNYIPKIVIKENLDNKNNIIYKATLTDTARETFGIKIHVLTDIFESYIEFAKELLQYLGTSQYGVVMKDWEMKKFKTGLGDYKTVTIYTLNHPLP